MSPRGPSAETGPAEPPVASVGVRQTWLSGRAVALHLTVLVVVVSFCLLARWQVDRAVAGNTLSWAYAFEWPFFALYAIYMWWRLLHDSDSDDGGGRPIAQQSEKEVEALEEYNHWLAALHAHDRAEAPPGGGPAGEGRR